MREQVVTQLLIPGAFLLAGWVAHAVGARAHVPRASLLLLIGVAIGSIALDLVPDAIAEWFPSVAELALVAAERFPQYEATILTVVIAATVLFEVVGPFMTRWQLERAAEIGPVPGRSV